MNARAASQRRPILSAAWLLLLVMVLAGCSTAPRAPVKAAKRPVAGAVKSSMSASPTSLVSPAAPASQALASAHQDPSLSQAAPTSTPALSPGAGAAGVSAPQMVMVPMPSPPSAALPDDQKDGPGERVPPGPEQLPESLPRVEPLHRWANRPYAVMGRQFVPRTSVTEHRERGVASWYGRKFHGRSTASGERYDMYALTAAHPTLPIPSYVRVTHVRSGRSVVVRVNDRGPFSADRVIDLSFTAAHRLGIVDAGTAEVDIELVASPSGFAAGNAPSPALAQTPQSLVAPAVAAGVEPASPVLVDTRMPPDGAASAATEAVLVPASIEAILADRLDAPADETRR